MGCVNSFLLLPNNLFESVMQCQSTPMGCKYFPVNILLALFTYTFCNVNFKSTVYMERCGIYSVYRSVKTQLGW